MVSLDHDPAACPVVAVPGLEWYTQLVMHEVSSDVVRVQHAYRSERNHRVEVLGCAGLVSDPAAPTWAATYNRQDSNLVDGDNVQVKLGMDAALDAWPAGGRADPAAPPHRRQYPSPHPRPVAAGAGPPIAGLGNRTRRALSGRPRPGSLRSVDQPPTRRHAAGAVRARAGAGGLAGSVDLDFKPAKSKRHGLLSCLPLG